MSRVIWGQVGKRSFEAGIDRGVLYVENSFGVPWNGLTSVNETPTGGEPRPYYLDGVKYLNLAAKEEFEATINALSAPPEFAVCDGTKSLGRGLFATQQKRKQFDFTYRTLVGNDIQGTDHGYKIHLVYNALAKPSSRNQQTITRSSTPLALSWAVSTIPEIHDGMLPTSHFVVDSRTTHPFIMTYLESVLYGMPGTDPRMPSVKELVAIFNFPVDDLDVTLNLIGIGSSDKGRVTNLFPNPDVEAASSVTTDAYVNLSANPWHRSDGVNPLTTNNGNSYYVDKGVTFSGENVPATPDGITSGAMCTPHPSNVGSILVSAYNADNLANINLERSGGCWVYVSRSGYRGILGGGTMTPLTPNGWTWLKSAPVAAGSYMSIVITHEENVQPGDFAMVTGATVLFGKTAPNFAIWGSMTSPDPDFTVTYAGANPLLSETRISAIRPALMAAVSNAWGSAFESKKRKIDGQKSLRVGPYGEAALIANTSIGAYSSVGPYTETGKDYTFVCNVIKEGPTSVLPSIYGMISFYNGATLINSEQSDNVAGIFQPRVKTKKTQDTFQLRYVHGQPKGSAPDVYFDTITLVEGDYSGPPFSPNADVIYRKQTLRPKWVGTPNASASYFEYYQQLSEAANPGDAYIIENQLFVFVDDMWRLIGVIP